MPINIEHARRDPKSHPDNPVWQAIEHEWTLDLLALASVLVEEDGGPSRALGSGYGVNHNRREVEHVMSTDYPGQLDLRAGDRLRFWRS